MATITDFVGEHGRLPMLDKGERPWSYRGWLGWYVQAMHAHPSVAIPDRWGYLAAIKLSKVDPGPIPVVDFADRPHPGVVKAIGKYVEIAGSAGGHGFGWGGFCRFLDWLSFGLGVGLDEPSLTDPVQEQLYRQVNLQPWLEHPYDYIGHYICEGVGTGFNPMAFFPTPHSLCEVMFAMLLQGQSGDLRMRSVCDPCMGTGRMLLHASNYCLRLFGQDIDPIMVQATKIQGALYAPWLVCSVGEGELPGAEVAIRIPPPPPPPIRRKAIPPPPPIHVAKLGPPRR